MNCSIELSGRVSALLSILLFLCYSNISSAVNMTTRISKDLQKTLSSEMLVQLKKDFISIYAHTHTEPKINELCVAKRRSTMQFMCQLNLHFGKISNLKVFFLPPFFSFCHCSQLSWSSPSAGSIATQESFLCLSPLLEIDQRCF